MDQDGIEQLNAGIEALTRLYERARDEQDVSLYTERCSSRSKRCRRYWIGCSLTDILFSRESQSPLLSKVFTS
jgi:hypothetical protein